MLRNIIIGLVVIVLAVVGYGFTLPDKTHVDRSTVIAATPAKVHGVLNDLKNFNKFSPWYQLEPTATYSYEGPAAGVGQKMIWSGAESGSQTIVESQPGKLVRTELDFGMMGKPVSTFVLEPQGNATKVTWSFDTNHEWNVISRFFGNFAAEPEVGEMYAKGLVSLKGLVEGTPDTTAQTSQSVTTGTGTAAQSTGPFALLVASAMKPGDEPTVVTLEARPVVMARGTASTKKPDEVSAALGEAYSKVSDFIAKHDLSSAGAPLAITQSFDEAAGTWVFDAALPVTEIPEGTPTEEDGVKTGTTPAGKAVMIVHKGAYSAISPAYEKIAAYMKANNLQEGANSIEEYANDPGEVEETELLTNVYFFTK
jgi:effector-binding domain-containing protein